MSCEFDNFCDRPEGLEYLTTARMEVVENWNELGGSHVTSFHVEHNFLQLDISSKYQKGKFKLAMYLLQKTGGKISGRK